jgi:hypothetical protein
MTPAVVDYQRMERLALVDDGPTMNLNTISIIIIILAVLLMYKRYVDVSRNRRRWHT